MAGINRGFYAAPALPIARQDHDGRAQHAGFPALCAFATVEWDESERRGRHVCAGCDAMGGKS